MGMKGKDKAVRRIRALAGPGLEKFVGPALFAAGELLATEAQTSITRGSAGGTSGGKHQHIPSRPGEPPHNFTGHLANSIEVTQPNPLLVRVTSQAPYSAALEFGTSKMEARPFMRPARDKTRKEGLALIQRGVAQFVKSTKQGG